MLRNHNIYFPWIEINLSAILHNIKLIKRKIGKNVNIMAIVKDDAYGHGIIQVAKVLVKNKVNMLGVSSLKEAIYLRNCGIRSTIVMLTPLLSGMEELIIDNNIIPSVCSEKEAKLLNYAGNALKKRVTIHLNIDTGMGRVGIPFKFVEGVFERIRGLDNLKVKGIFSTFASAGKNKSFTTLQIKRFKDVSRISRKYFNIKFFHIANSDAIIRFPESYFNMVRPGLIIYGALSDLSHSLKLKPAMSVKSRVIFVKKVPKNTSISYDKMFVSKKPMRLATVYLGYSHGFSRILSNKGVVLIKGKRARVCGNVCMDQIIVDVSNIENVRIGDEVVFIGKQNNAHIKVEEVARQIGTIPYEIFCSVGNNIKKYFIQSSS